MKIEIKKTTTSEEVYYAAYEENSKFFIGGTCVFVTANKTDEQAIEEVEKAAKIKLTQPIVETVKTIEI